MCCNAAFHRTPERDKSQNHRMARVGKNLEIISTAKGERNPMEVFSGRIFVTT